MQVLELEQELATGHIYLRYADRSRRSTVYKSWPLSGLVELLVDCDTREPVGYDCFGFDYGMISEALRRHPVPGPFAVPALGLSGVGLLEIYEEIYRAYRRKI
ncbi:MAG: hypothetical protein AB1523_09625 [Bacillota bacterium]